MKGTKHENHSKQKTKIKIDQDKEATVAEVSAFILTRPRKEGYSIQDVRSINKILDVLEKDGKELKLEDADYKILNEAVNNYKWPIPGKNIEEFVNEINGAK